MLLDNQHVQEQSFVPDPMSFETLLEALVVALQVDSKQAELFARWWKALNFDSELPHEPLEMSMAGDGSAVELAAMVRSSAVCGLVPSVLDLLPDAVPCPPVKRSPTDVQHDQGSKVAALEDKDWQASPRPAMPLQEEAVMKVPAPVSAWDKSRSLADLDNLAPTVFGRTGGLAACHDKQRWCIATRQGKSKIQGTKDTARGHFREVGIACTRPIALRKRPVQLVIESGQSSSYSCCIRSACEIACIRHGCDPSQQWTATYLSK
jgi:hypothetical protein